MVRRHLFLAVFTLLVLTQMVCSLSGAFNPTIQLTNIAGQVEKTAGVLQKTADALQKNAPTLEGELRKTLQVLQTQGPTLESEFGKTLQVLQTQAPGDAASLNKTLSALGKMGETQFPGLATELPNNAQTGSISGNLSYPADVLPPLTVVAFQLKNGSISGINYMVDTQGSQSTYQITGLPAGKYEVVAYLRVGTLKGINGLAGGYTQAVVCGLSATCTDHHLVIIDVEAGKTTDQIDPGDWYAPAGSFPSVPAK